MKDNYRKKYDTVFQEPMKRNASFEIGSRFVSTLYIPEIFLPNGDGLNDFFRTLLKNYQNFEMTILNRWGQIIAQINDLKTGWDGTYKGTISPNGYCHYIIKFQTTKDMKRRHFQGGFYLVR